MKDHKSSHPYYLLGSSTVIEIKDKLSIARKDGNLYLHSNTPGALTISLDEKSNSAQKILVNNIPLEPGQSIQLKVGDLLQYDGQSFKVFDDKEEVDKLKPPHERRKYRRPKNKRDLKNFVDFFAAWPQFLFCYACLFAFVLWRFFFHLKVDAPESISFLAEYYNDNFLMKGILVIVVTYLLCLAHSFAMILYFNRNSGRRFIITTILLASFGVFTFWIYHPYGKVKEYLSSRESILQPPHASVAILNVLELIEDKRNITHAYEFIKTEILSDQNRAAFEEDYLNLINEIDKKLKHK